MPRAIANALLLILGPLQIGVAVTIVHPALDRPECWPVTLLTAVCMFEAARRNLEPPALKPGPGCGFVSG